MSHKVLSADQNQINDAVVHFYYATVDAHQYNDTLYQELGDQGYTGTLQDRQFAWLGAGGYTGALQDRMQGWLHDQGMRGQLNDMILGYYDRDPSEGSLVTYDADSVYYDSDPTDLVTYAG